MITISGVEVDVISGSLSIDDAIGERSTASFTVKTALGVSYNQGMPVEITDTEVIFAGLIDTVNEKKINGADFLYHEITCKDWHYLADKRVLGKAYTPISVTNIISNPGFESDLTGWTTAGSTVEISTAHYKYGTKSLKTASVSEGGALVRRDNVPIVNGHKYYISAWCKNTSLNQTRVFAGFSGGDLFFPANIDWTHLSKVVTANVSSASLLIGYPGSKGDGLPGYIDGILIIDLTAAFGAGNEPTKAWCDKYIQYDEGTYDLTLTTGYIVNDILTSKLAAEGITAGTIGTGIEVDEAVFNYDYINNCLNTLAEKSNYIWYIDYDKKLYFVPRETFTAPFEVTEDDVLPDLTVQRGNPQYRNRQIIRGAVALTDAQTETFKGDGETTTFSVAYPIAATPTVKVNGTTKTVGIRGVDESKDWYWNKGDKTISSETKLTSSDTLSIQYQGEYSIIIISSDGGEIASRAGIEDNTGIVDEVSSVDNSPSSDIAFEIAAQKLTQYGTISKRVNFTTMTSGLAAGQIVKVDFPSHDIYQELLIESVNITESAGLFYYSVTAIDGAIMGSWTKMFKDLIDRSQPTSIFQNISENEAIITVLNFTKTWSSGESPNIFRDLFTSSTLYPSATLYPCFDYEKRVKYISFSYGGVEKFRKQISTQTDDVTSIISLCYISPDELNYAVDKVAWYGGVSASATLGSGIKVDEQSFLKTKAQNESLQITKTDTRWT